MHIKSKNIHNCWAMNGQSYSLVNVFLDAVPTMEERLAKIAQRNILSVACVYLLFIVRYCLNWQKSCLFKCKLGVVALVAMNLATRTLYGKAFYGTHNVELGRNMKYFFQSRGSISVYHQCVHRSLSHKCLLAFSQRTISQAYQNR